MTSPFWKDGLQFACQRCGQCCCGEPGIVYFSPSEFDALAREADACILFYRWREKWKLGAHFVALREQNGSFLGYNTYRNSTGPDPYGPSLEAFLEKRGYFTPFLIAIQKKPASPTGPVPYSR